MAPNVHIFDPALVVPSEFDLFDPMFWERLFEWSSIPYPPLMGQATYLHFSDNYAEWMSTATNTSFKGYARLIAQIASRVVEPWQSERTTGPLCVHVMSAYQIDRVRDLLAEDLDLRSDLNVQLATESAHWKPDEDAQVCVDCAAGAVIMLLSPSGPLADLITGASIPLFPTKLPIERVGACKYDDYHNHYVQDLDTDLWWTVDFARHGGVAFKTYRLQSDGLHYDADRDEHGDPILAKHKGAVGIFLSINSLQNCSQPQKHV